jgi:hypothetical protein
MGIPFVCADVWKQKHITLGIAFSSSSSRLEACIPARTQPPGITLGGIFFEGWEG